MTTLRTSLVSMGLCLLVAVGCGSSSDSNVGGGASGGGDSGGEAPGGGGSGGGLIEGPPCPVAPPTAGDACDLPSGSVCAYPDESLGETSASPVCSVGFSCAPSDGTPGTPSTWNAGAGPVDAASPCALEFDQVAACSSQVDCYRVTLCDGTEVFCEAVL